MSTELQRTIKPRTGRLYGSGAGLCLMSVSFGRTTQNSFPSG